MHFPDFHHILDAVFSKSVYFKFQVIVLLKVGLELRLELTEVGGLLF
jgi:hypothetical protein